MYIVIYSNMQVRNPTEFREKICARLHTVIGGDNDKIAINIEKGVLNYTIREATFHSIVKKWENQEFVHIYCDRLRSIYMNLKNENFCQQIRSGELGPEQVAFMTHQEINHDRWKEQIDRKIKREESKLHSNVAASTDMFTCRKCKSKRCTYYELQTRSADEPATVFITCLDCGKHWKM